MVTDRADKAGMAGGEGEALNAMLSGVPPLVLPPLFAPSAGAFAAATVMGLGFANQMAGAYLGFLKGAVETTRLMAEVMGAPEPQGNLPEEARVEASETVEKPGKTATIHALQPRAAKTAVGASQPAARKAPAKPASDKKAKPASGKVTAKPPVRADERPAATVLDLRSLPGIGPKLEAMLKARGLGTLEAIAALTPDAAAALDRELGLDGRIERDRWVEKAAALARG